tara:strand:- start:286 stop:516 length:231 start_codon:yes stop_codon:yes gene_type:complete
MTADKRWKVVELSTNGWTTFDPNAVNLTKEECDKWLKHAVDSGVAPNRLQAIPTEMPDSGLESIDPESNPSGPRYV